MDHDRLFKELLSTFFLDFLRLFVPELADELEDASLVPLDKEVFTDVTAGDRHEVDLLVQARLKQHEAFFLIHVETQAKAQPDFPERMFRYFARLRERHGLPVYPIAVLSYERPRRVAPETFSVTIAGFDVLCFRFRSIQLNRLSWRDFNETQNPVACALMAKMGVAPEDRGRVKWACYRLLATLRLDPARTSLIGGFIDTYLRLDEVQEREFQRELAQAAPAEREAIVELSNPWIRQGEQQGLEKGRQEGRQKEAVNLVTRLLTKRLGTLSPERTDAVSRLSVEQLEALAEAVFEISRDGDLDAWLTSF